MEQVPPFHRRVYETARSIAPGQTLSYGDLAARLGQPGAARAVGQALGKNPFALVVPCHRVLAADGRMGGFSANGGVTTKLRLLSIERDGTRLNGTAAPELTAAELGYDPVAAVAHLRDADSALARLIDTVGPFRMRVDRTSSLFLALAEAIVYQQLTGKAAATIFARVQALFPRAHEGLNPAHIRRASDEKLRGAGLSRNKLLSLRDLAEKTLAGVLPSLEEVHALDDEAIVERLTQVRGIGRWTVEMLLIFRLGRADVLPVDDYGVRKGFARRLSQARAADRRGARAARRALEAVSLGRQLVSLARRRARQTRGARERSNAQRARAQRSMSPPSSSRPSFARSAPPCSSSGGAGASAIDQRSQLPSRAPRGSSAAGTSKASRPNSRRARPSSTASTKSSGGAGV